MKKVVVLLAIGLMGAGAFAQQRDTLQLMFYNLLNFPAGTSGIPNRQDSLKKIIQYVKPDVFMVCELSNATGANQIMTGALNTAGVTYYQMATFTSNTSSGDALHQMMFYNGNVLGLKSQGVLQTNLRDINHYVLYYKDPNLAIHNDTASIDLFVAHLKASTGLTNETQRNQMVTVLRNHLNTYPTQRNFFFAGDFNIYSNSEPAFQTITTTGLYPLQDPINRPGAWNNNAAFADIHTQCTRSTALSDGASGGLDDRFDWIMASSNVISGAQKVRYIPGTYKAVGQDGLHFNNSVNALPANLSVPAGLANTLYYMSDHLPVSMQIEVTMPSLLPITMGKLEGSWSQGIAKLGIALDDAAEENITLERSADGSEFAAISEAVSLLGNHLAWNTSLGKGKQAWFRVKAEGPNGEFQYSNVAHIKAQGPEIQQLSAFFDDRGLHVNLNIGAFTRGRLEVHDALGRLEGSMPVELSSDGAYFFPGIRSTGIHTIVFREENGDVTRLKVMALE